MYPQQHPMAQPYAKGMGTRGVGHALAAMLAGSDLYGMNPIDLQRKQMMGQQQGSLTRLLMQGYQH